MKKTVVLCSCFVLFFLCLSGCHIEYRETGLSNYSKSLGSFELCHDLAFGLQLGEQYGYLDGDFEYYQQILGLNDRETAILYMVFEDDAYEDVKQYTLDNLDFSTENRYVYNGYCFYENITERTEKSIWEFPRWASMVAISDEKKTIVFFGFYISVTLGDMQNKKTLKKLTDGDIEPFLKEYFSFYDFSK